ncbi:PIN domain-containing protein [Streptomyces violaceoruber]|uniref:PIN domain-containing protein n=1 Tax=Streptomyces violaceoruber group TaxID=2867121 RepID=UPI0033C290B6
MIILDTNIVDGFRLDSVSSDLLKTIRTSKVDRVAVPSVVMDELISHRAVPYREKHQKAVEALERFGKSTPWPTTPSVLPQLDMKACESHWKKQYSAVAEVIQTSAEALQEAFRRESNVLPPCKAVVVSEGGDTVKTGGRDAAIWLTAVEYARQHPEETVYFVSRNTKDFGDGTSYPAPMHQDLNGIADRFVHLTTLAQVVERFAVETDVDLEAVESFLPDAETLDDVSAVAYIKHRLRPGPLARRSSFYEGTPLADPASADGESLSESVPITSQGWLTAPKARFSSARDVKAYRIGDHVWCMATVRWLLAGVVLPDESADPATVGVAWETRMLLSTTERSSRPTILRAFHPKPADASEFDTFPEIPRARRRPLANLARGREVSDEILARTGTYDLATIKAWLNDGRSAKEERLRRLVARAVQEHIHTEALLEE